MASESSLKIIFLFLVALAVVFEIIGDILSKKWSINHKNILLYLGLLVYFVGTVFWAVSLKYEYLSKAVSIFTVLNLIIIAIVGAVYFNEDLSLVNKAGILTGIISVVLIEI